MTTNPPQLSLGTVEYVAVEFDAVLDKWTEKMGLRVDEIQPGRSALVVSQGTRLKLVAAATDGASQGWAQRHGDGVRDLSFECADPQSAYEFAVSNGATPIDPSRLKVEGFGEVSHSFVARSTESRPQSGDPYSEIDHFAVCLEPGTIRDHVSRYQSAFGFREIYSERTVVGDQAMLSHVVSSPDRSICFTLIEPDTSMAAGQIDGFLDRNAGAGVQHVALSTPNIVRSVRSLSAAGINFMSTPAEYYDSLEQHYAPRSHTMAELRETDVLLDEDEGGQLFQIFSESDHERRTFFWELIERRGAETFGSRNIKALYEAVEHSRTVGSTR